MWHWFTLAVRFWLKAVKLYVSLAPVNAPGALEMKVAHVQDVGTHMMLSATCAEHTVKARLSSDADQLTIGKPIWLKVMDEHTCFYKNEEIVQ